MDLTGLLLRAAAGRPHVLIAAMPGGTAVRLAAEAELRRRGWPVALTPADADVLLVAGAAAADIAGAVEQVWAAVPAPRVLVRVSRPDEVAAVLDAARTQLADVAGQRRAAGARSAAEPDMGRHSTGGHSMNGQDTSGQDTGGHSMGSMGGEHHGHDMGSMEMPGGLPMAERAADRDGLKLDQLHVALGPVLADWPGGLVVRLALQGDVVQQASAEAVGLSGDGSFWAEPWRRAAAGERITAGAGARRRAAAHLDSLARFLAVAGWADAASTARTLRDRALGDSALGDSALGGMASGGLGPVVRRFGARVGRSRLLAWSTRGIGVVAADDAVAWGVPDAVGDVTARYRRWCRDLAELAGRFEDDAVLDGPGLDGSAPASAAGALLAVLPRLLTGAEFAAARLIVASLDPDLDELTARVGAHHDH